MRSAAALTIASACHRGNCSLCIPTLPLIASATRAIAAPRLSTRRKVRPRKMSELKAAPVNNPAAATSTSRAVTVSSSARDQNASRHSGSVTGVVGAAGGLGGFFPPQVMGAVSGSTGDHSLGYVLLALTAFAALAYTATEIRRQARLSVTPCPLPVR